LIAGKLQYRQQWHWLGTDDRASVRRTGHRRNVCCKSQNHVQQNVT